MSQIAQYLSPERILISSATTRDGVLEELVKTLDGVSAVADLEQLRRAVFEREAQCSTGIGLGIAVPHVRLVTIREMVMATALTLAPVDFQSLDRQGVRLVFLVASPISAQRDYLRILTRIALIARDEPRRQQFFAATRADQLWQLIQSCE